jgi:hypothetical protein
LLLVGGGGPWHVPEEERTMLPISEALDALESDIRKVQRANSQLGLQLAELLRDVEALRTGLITDADNGPVRPLREVFADPEVAAQMVKDRPNVAPVCVHKDRNAVACNGPAAFLVNYYQGAGAHKQLADTVSPLCYAHATYEAGSFGRASDAYHSAEWQVIARMIGDEVERLPSGVERHTYRMPADVGPLPSTHKEGPTP